MNEKPMKLILKVKSDAFIVISISLAFIFIAFWKQKVENIGDCRLKENLGVALIFFNDASNRR